MLSRSRYAHRLVENDKKAPGVSPLLQQRELDFSPAEKNSILKMGFSPGVWIPGAKAMIKVRVLPER